MKVRPRIIRNFVNQYGQEPFGEWLDSIKDKKALPIILERINRLRIGNLDDCKYLGEGVYELKINYGPGYRMYFGDVDGVVLLLCGRAMKRRK
jgi:putative addiction module killer protein